MNCARSTKFKLSAAPRIAPGAIIGAAPTLAPIIGTPATNTVATAMVTANLPITTSERFIKSHNMSELPSDIDVNQGMSGTRHLAIAVPISLNGHGDPRAANFQRDRSAKS